MGRGQKGPLTVFPLKLEPRRPLKTSGFSGQTLIKLRLRDNFSHRNATVTKPWSHEHIYKIILIT